MKIMSDVARDALELPPNQRLSLARFLLDVSDGEAGFDPDANEAWEEEISQRIEKIRNGTARSIPLEEVFADRDRRFPGLRFTFSKSPQPSLSRRSSIMKTLRRDLECA